MDVKTRKEMKNAEVQLNTRKTKLMEIELERIKLEEREEDVKLEIKEWTEKFNSLKSQN